MASVRRAIYKQHGGFYGNRILIDRLEYRALPAADSYAWDAEAWFGGDINRLWLKTAGEGRFAGTLHHSEVQALFSHAIGAFFNLQGGIRQDFGESPNRTHVAVGVQGLAPYLFEIDAAAFLSAEGKLTARLEAEYDQRITNRLIMQPRIELNLASQNSGADSVGIGSSNLAVGIRVRYEIVPEFAPYLGFEWEKAIGRTVTITSYRAENIGGWAIVAGYRTWF